MIEEVAGRLVSHDGDHVIGLVGSSASEIDGDLPFAVYGDGVHTLTGSSGLWKPLIPGRMNQHPDGIAGWQIGIGAGENLLLRNHLAVARVFYLDCPRQLNA